MTKSTITQRNQDVADYLRNVSITDDQSTTSQTSPGIKTPADSAVLAQELASETSWADRYVPSTPSGTIMTPPASSVAANSEVAHQGTASQSDFVTPDEAPPTYETATSETNPGSTSELDGQPRAPTQPSSQPRPHELMAPFSEPRAHELMASSSQPQPQQLSSERPSRESRPWRPNRRFSQHETSNSITGTYTVYDELDLSTTSGSIGIKLDVKPGKQPAMVKLKTKSGSVRIDDAQCDEAQSWRSNSGCSSSRPGPFGPGRGPLSFLFGWGKKTAEIEPPPMPVTDDPRKQPGQALVPTQEPQAEEVDEEKFAARPIHISIETSSGSAGANLILTSDSAIQITTSSGSINLRLITADSSLSASRPLTKIEQEDPRNLNRPRPDLGSTLRTQTNSGSQNVYINSGLADTSDGAIISACRAEHHIMGSGSLNLAYPKDWQGLVHASCGGSGSINVRGQGLEYDKRGNKEVYAWRGVDEPDLNKAIEVRCDGSGSMQFSC